MDTRPTMQAFCNVLAIEKGLNPAGYADNFDDMILFEVPLPWKRDIYQKAGILPQQAIDLLGIWLEEYYETKRYPHRPLLIVHDPEYSQKGWRRVMFYTRQTGDIAQFDKVEYQVPEEELGDLLWALYQAREDLPRFEQYRQPDKDHTRDLLVCTHGTIDAACAKFGHPLYKNLRHNHANDDVRVWRVSHFGGHVFAPTMIEMPTAHFWAYVEEPQALQIVGRDGDIAGLNGHYRGWGGVAGGFLQSAEAEMLQRHGWDWFNAPKSGETIEQDPKPDKPEWAVVQLQAQLPEGMVRYEVRVEIQQYIETFTTTGNQHTYNYPQYVVVDVKQI
jgi:hypothetical protein